MYDKGLPRSGHRRISIAACEVDASESRQRAALEHPVPDLSGEGERLPGLSDRLVPLSEVLVRQGQADECARVRKRGFRVTRQP